MEDFVALQREERTNRLLMLELVVLAVALVLVGARWFHRGGAAGTLARLRRLGGTVFSYFRARL